MGLLRLCPMICYNNVHLDISNSSSDLVLSFSFMSAFPLFCLFLLKNLTLEPGVVAHTCNPSHLGG